MAAKDPCALTLSMGQRWSAVMALLLCCAAGCTADRLTGSLSGERVARSERPSAVVKQDAGVSGADAAPEQRRQPPRDHGVVADQIEPSTWELLPVSLTEPGGAVEQAASQPVATAPADRVVAAETGAMAEDAALAAVDLLPALETRALTANPTLRRLQQQAAAAQAKVGSVDGLPDPRLGANVFVAPVETAAGSQRANLSFSQAIPWLERLDAKRQQACLEAMALQQQVRAEQLRIVGDVRALWYRLYLIDRQLEISTANQQLIKDLMDVANARVATGLAAQGDVLSGTLEYSRVEQRLLSLRQQRQSAEAELNRVLGRPADVLVVVPASLPVELPDTDHPQLRDRAMTSQPLIQSALIQSQATRWGVEVARLQRRPDFAVSATWFEIDSNRPQPGVVDIGRDAWSLGASLSIPLWERKYDAIENEARWKHAAAHAGVQQLQQQFDAQLRDLWQQAVTASETASLYQDTILPQARDTLRADQQAYATGSVEFDRVIKDCRNLLTLESGYHQAISQLATALARTEQAVGAPL